MLRLRLLLLWCLLLLLVLLRYLLLLQLHGRHREEHWKRRWGNSAAEEAKKRLTIWNLMDKENWINSRWVRWVRLRVRWRSRTETVCSHKGGPSEIRAKKERKESERFGSVRFGAWRRGTGQNNQKAIFSASYSSQSSFLPFISFFLFSLFFSFYRLFFQFLSFFSLSLSLCVGLGCFSFFSSFRFFLLRQFAWRDLNERLRAQWEFLLISFLIFSMLRELEWSLWKSNEHI